MNHPFQGIEEDKDGVIRFKENKIVSYLLAHGGIDLNALSRINFTPEDRQQFAQLIGYSVSGFCELYYVPPLICEKALKMAEQLNHAPSHLEIENKILKEKISKLRDELREPIADLFNIHPDDLK